MASATWYHLPSRLGRSPANMPLMIWSASSSFSKRSVNVPNSKPSESCSSSNQPAPMPSWARPPETMSRVVSVFASSVGLRYVLPVTRAERRTVSVCWASAESSV